MSTHATAASGSAVAHPARSQARRARPTVTDADVPERPALADGVELSGQMQDSAFKEQPWLILRGGAFVQVSELLYRLAEQCDGRRTRGEAAERLGAAVGRDITEENVRQLLREKLIPLGVVAKADGSAVPVAAGADERSPLQINARMRTIGPEIIEPAAAVFQVLFWPPILAAMTGIGFAVIGWVFLVQGLGQGFHNAIYQPGLIVVLLPIVIASAFFHEFGHAAALKYGGGKVRGMGAGIYLAYPVFYTDVTDNYRLGRWAKVRTDTGGFYFNLIFAIALMGLYLLTGQPFLLLAILLIVISIVQQTLPFVRLDGYWTVSDLTGVPDLLSHIGPFVRSMVPFLGLRGRRLPPLKGWVKVVFAIYILLTIPLLLVLTFYMVSAAPRILATAWDSFVQQLGAFGEAWSLGDALAIVAAILGMGVLVLLVVGIVYFLFRLTRAVLGRLWGWAGQSAGRRVVAGIATLGLAALVVWLWLPPLDVTGQRGGPLFLNFRPLAPDEPMTIGQAAGDISGAFITGEAPSWSSAATASPESSPSSTEDPDATPEPSDSATEPSPTPTPRSTPTPEPTP